MPRLPIRILSFAGTAIPIRILSFALSTPSFGTTFEPFCVFSFLSYDREKMINGDSPGHYCLVSSNSPLSPTVFMLLSPFFNLRGLSSTL
jgi:hypothetical protein